MKTSEARILIYLKTANTALRTIKTLSLKLNIDYSYVCKIVDKMVDNKWLKREKYPLHTYYILTDKAPIKEAIDKKTRS